MRAVVDALWEAFRGQGYSWVGFYLKQPAAADNEQLLLGPRRDKPACSSIGLHGACGQAFLSRQTLIVRDVKDRLACDARFHEILSYSFGRDLGLGDGTYDYAVVGDFNSAEDFRTYSAHPEHVRVVATCIKPILKDVVRVQMEV